MPTLPLKPQANGFFQGWESFVGASDAWATLDDSEGSGHDSDTTYLILPVSLAPGSTVSFHMFLRAEGLNPTSITLRVAAKQGTPMLATSVLIGFARGGIAAFDAVEFEPGSAYETTTRTFTTDPIAGTAWTSAGLIGLQGCLRVSPSLFGAARITLFNGSLEYTPDTNVVGMVSHLAVTG